MNTSKITCPNCDHQFNAEESIAKDLEEKYKKEFIEQQQKLIADKENQDKKVEAEIAKLNNEKIAFEENKNKAKAEYLERLKGDKEKIRLELKEKAEKDAEEKSELKLKQLAEDLEKSKAEKNVLQRKEIEFLKKESELKEKQEQLDIQVQKQIFEAKQKIEEDTKLKEAEKFELQKKEFQKKMDDQQKLIDEMKRKSEQGSMQLQGEVQELAIEDELRAQFPFDLIEEVGKGVRGADCIQTIRNNLGVECGKIVFESKRTKDFSKDWINKLKDDARRIKADIAVLITKTLPKGQKSFKLIDGVWVCDFKEFLSLSLALRDGIIKVQKVQDSNENKGDKMQMLYSFLTGNEFKSQVEGIVEAFNGLQDDLDKEKSAMLRIWKRREKQIERVKLNTINMYSSVEGIAGSSIQPIESLGLGGLLEE
jgi:hypothetical protein